MTTVRDVMSGDPLAVEPTTTVLEAARRMFAARVGSALVVRSGNLEGIFTERDIMRSLAGVADAGRGSQVAKWMTESPTTISPDATVGEALDVMLGGGFRHLPVLEEDRLVGVVSMRDLAGSIQKG